MTFGLYNRPSKRHFSGVTNVIYYTVANFGSSRGMNLSHNEPKVITKIPQNIPIVSAVQILNV